MSFFNFEKSDDTPGDTPEEQTINTEPDIIIDGDTVKYIGEVVSVHDSYCYIGKVKRGYQTINTNGDVFCPQVFEVSLIVEFTELNDDPKRNGKFRTEEATAISEGITKMDTEKRIATIKDLSQRSIYHATAKKIPEEKVQEAAKNEPFAELMGLHAAAAEAPEQATADLVKRFLAANFANLQSIGVDYSVDEEVDKEEEADKINDAVRRFQAANLDGQVESIQREYEKFSGIRDAFELMHHNGILGIESILPNKFIVDLLVASPVWYTHEKAAPDIDDTNEFDPRIRPSVKHFCDMVRTKNFAWLFQIYNRRTRPLSKFSGRDVIPLDLLELIEQAKATFDYVVIATPYHDIASWEWADPTWLRSLDPFLLGFMEEMDYFFLLGRWSGTGLFPLVCDMIADTVDHLRLNKNRLAKFPKNSYWYKGKTNYLQADGDGGNNILVPFAEDLIAQYEDRKLFPWLRGELKTDEIEEKATD